MDNQTSKLQERLNGARDKVGDTLGAIAEKADVSEFASSVSERLPDASAVRAGLKNPAVLAVGLLAAGVIVGLVAPLSSAERRTLRPLGTEVARRAADARDEVIDQSKAVLTETVAAARESAERHGQDLAANLGVSTGAANGSHA